MDTEGGESMKRESDALTMRGKELQQAFVLALLAINLMKNVRWKCRILLHVMFKMDTGITHLAFSMCSLYVC